jgi:hypothetical protein
LLPTDNSAAKRMPSRAINDRAIAHSSQAILLDP